MRTWLALLLSVAIAACATPRPALYDALGGEVGIERISGRFIAAIADDAMVRPFFAHSNLDRFHEKFSEHLCDIADGPCDYAGDSMQRVHDGMQVDEASFNRVVDLLIEAMNDEGIAHGVQNRLLARLAPLRAEIIYR